MFSIDPDEIRTPLHPYATMYHFADDTLAWTVPPGITKVQVECYGGGGGGVWASNLISVTPGQTYQFALNSPQGPRLSMSHKNARIRGFGGGGSVNIHHNGGNGAQGSAGCGGGGGMSSSSGGAVGGGGSGCVGGSGGSAGGRG